MSETAARDEAPDENLRQKLVLRIAFAGVLIALLLAALAFIDYLGRPGDEGAATGPAYTAPVPVAKKDVSQPVKPAEPEPAAGEAKADETKEAPPAEGSAAPPAPGVATEAPPKPQVSAQPALPSGSNAALATGSANAASAASAPPSARSTRAAAAETPREGTMSAQFADTAKPAAEKPPAVPAAAVPAGTPPAPPRLINGYAVQAGVFADAQHAEELRAKLMLNGIPATMEARVQVGPFKSRAEAEAARENMKALGVDGILLPPKGRK